MKTREAFADEASYITYLQKLGRVESMNGKAMQIGRGSKVVDAPTKLPSIYLAGKITRNDWRNDFLATCEEDVSLYPPETEWQTVPRGIWGAFDYAGPFFVGCDHGCYHGDNSHGVGASTGGCYSGLPSATWQKTVWERCKKAIGEADLVFAWVDSLDAYGTLAEISYASARGRHVWLASPAPIDDWWLVQQMVQHVCIGVMRPSHAFASMLIAHGKPEWLSALANMKSWPSE